jgi:hypothetical protein
MAKLPPGLVMSRPVRQAALRVARRVASRAKSIDPDAQLEIKTLTIYVNGLPRIGTHVINRAPSAARNEFGNSRTQAKRALGRAAAEVAR